MQNVQKNFGFRNKSGILMAVSSLPSKYGIGSFGKSAYDFVDFVADTKSKCWQVLPLNPTSYGDSPYQSPAAVAGNPYYIDLDILAKQGLLTKEEQSGAQKVLKAAAMTYVAALATSLLSLLRLIIIANHSRRD